MKRLAIIALSAALAASCCSCSDGVSPALAAATTTRAVTTTTQAPTTTTQPPVQHINFLTGRDEMGSDEYRPVAVMIGNNDKSRPQYGIEQADMLIEGETEGGITRIMAVFADASRMPDAVGPCRSARTPFVKLATALDAVYCHCGGSPGGLNTLRAANLADIDGQIYDGSTFWRDQGLINAKGYEYSMLTNGQKVASRIAAQGYRTAGANHSPFVFGNKKGDKKAAGVQIYLSPAQTVSFKYDAGDGLYYKRNGTLSGGTPHTTASGDQLSAANVIILYDSSRYVEQTSTWGAAIYGYEMSSGSGWLLSGGTARAIGWSRSDSGLDFTEEDGTPLTVATGRSYLCFVYSGYSQSTVIQ
ncbi:MAG: DUF3048 domain-containing protein [Acutalibacteraceae bacterium]|jgi:hypothetical protein